MKKFYIHIVCALIIVTLIFASCSKSDEFSLTETIFIEDPYLPGLPIYSEWGYNTFGTYIDRKPFVSTSEELPSKIYVHNNTLEMLLRGKMNGEYVDLKFSLNGYSPLTNFDLVEFHKQVFNLKNQDIQVILKIGEQNNELEIIEGELEFKKVQILYLDEEPTRVIVSGYFQLKTFLNNEPIAISNGRFDLGYGYENFFNY